MLGQNRRFGARAHPRRCSMSVLVIDNYDSFVHNLARYCRVLGATTQVVRNDQITVAQVQALNPSHIILSPGPCTPSEAGICVELVRQLAGKVPILGVCLGHQAIAQAFGGEVVRASFPMHGKASHITHDATGVFANLPSPLKIGRYHSLVVPEVGLPDTLHVSARTSSGTIMALAHKVYPIYGVQFHPESVLTEHGFEMMQNFLQA